MCVRVRVHVCMCMCACTVHVHVLYTLNVSHTMDCDTRQRHCDMGHGERGLVRFCIQHIVQGPSQAAGDRAPSRRRALSRRQHATASQKAEIDNANASLRQMHICTRSNVARCEEMNGGGRGRLKTAQAHRPDAARLPPGGTHGPPESLGGQPRAAGGPSPRPSQRRLCPASAPRAGCGSSWSARRGPPLERGRAQCGRAATIRTR